MTKYCTGCCATKAVADFYKCKHGSQGVRHICKACWLANGKKQIARYRAGDVKVRDEKTCPKCRTTKPAADFARNRSNPDGLNSQCRVCWHSKCLADYAANPKQYAAWQRGWNARNPDHRRRLTREWNAKHPDAARLHLERKRARRHGATLLGSHTSEQWQSLCHSTDGRCVRCGRARKLTRDHIIPVSRGGSDDISNIQPLCRPCNSHKHDSTIRYALPA